MNIKRTLLALSIITKEYRLSELGIIGWAKLNDSPLKKAKRQLKAKTLGIVEHDRVLNWRK